MNLDFFALGGYGQFVWSAFTFTFLSCLILYLKTKKELQKQEKIFLKEYEQLYTVKIKSAERKKNTRQTLSGSPI